ncbi:MAG TPA: hypothetical protein VGP24_17125, partial [Glaciihabitans sp.]|nr:hypothetical protein [Glaciihabitans sp.]
MRSPKEFAVWLATNHPQDTPIATPQSANCKVAVVVPVRGERIERIERLVKSLARQQVTPGTIETLLVVNNRPDNGTATGQAQYAANQRLLASPLLTGSVHAIDLSSVGRSHPGSNVGTARQRGLIEAAGRFAARGTNGIVLHTDADCRFDDPTFFSRLIWVFDHYPKLVAAGGGHTLEVSADDP